jgi:hypothetical protein
MSTENGMSGVFTADNVHQYPDDNLWSAGTGWASNGWIPQYVLRLGGVVEVLPKSSMLTGDR